MKSEDKKRKGLRAVLAVILAILLLLAGIQLFFMFYLDSYVENRLTAAASNQTDGQYQLAVDDLNLSVWGRKLEVEKIRLHPADTGSAAPKVDIDQLSIGQIQFLSYLFNGSIQVGEVRLSNPQVSLVQNSPDSLIFLQSSDSTSDTREPPAINVDQFLIDNGTITYWNANQSGVRGELNDFDLDVDGIRIDSTTLAQMPYFRFQSIDASSGIVRYEMDNELYTLETNGIDFSTSKNIASLDSLKLIPKFPKYEFSQKVGHQLDRIDLTVERMLLQNPDIEKLKSGVLKAEKFTIQSADLEVFHDKTLPRRPKRDKTFPHILFRNLEVPVTIDTISVQNSEISYAEHLPDVSRPGKVIFADVNVTFSDVTNDSVAVDRGHEIKLDVTSEVMGEALLDAHYIFPMNKNGAHSVQGTLESIRVQKLNQILEPVGLVRAENGTIHSLQFMMDLGEEEATGWVQLVYSDLKIAVLDKENVEGGGRQRFKTFLANALKIKANNTKEPLRRGEVSFERLHDKSVFNYWWKSLSSGLKDNIGL